MGIDTGNQNLIGILTADAEFIVRVWDAVLEQMTSLSSAQAAGKSIIEIIPDLEARGLMARFRRVLEQGTIEILAPAFHHFLIPCPPQFDSKHFAKMRQHVTIAPLKENDVICGLIVTIEDVTGRMEQEIELARQLKSDDETRRLEAARTISEQSENLGEETAAPIIEALANQNWRVRRQLVEGLSRRAAPEAIAALLRAVQKQHFDFGVLNSALQVLQATSVKTTETLLDFLHSADADLRMQAALTLGEQHETQAIPALIDALPDENINVRYHVIEALGKLKAYEATAQILDIAESGNFFLSFVALDTLRQIADETIVDRIIPLLNDDVLREPVIETLGAIGNEEIILPLVDLINKEMKLVPVLASALTNLIGRYEENPQKQPSIVESVQTGIDINGKTNLCEALAKSNEVELTAIIRLSALVDDQEIRNGLAELLENENVREEAAAALVQQGDVAVELLIEKLSTSDLAVNQTAAFALGNFKNKRAVEALIEVLETDPELSPAAAAALGQIGDGEAFEPLIKLLEVGNAASRLAAVNALKLLAHPDTVARLCQMMTGTGPEFRESAIRVIGHFGAPGCEESIVQAAKDKDERVQRAALEQLPFITDERSISILINSLHHGASRRLRETAAQALARVKTRESLNALRTALDDPDAWVRYFAIRALGIWQDSASREKLSEIAEKDLAEQVRVAAHEVLKELKNN